MKTITLLFSLSLAAIACGQTSPSAPKKNAFEGFGNTGLDRKRPGLPSTSLTPSTPRPHSGPASQAGGVQLARNWDTPTALNHGGPLQQRQELHALLTGSVAPGKDTSPFPTTAIYRQITYLLPLLKSLPLAGLAGKPPSGGKPPVVGFPAGLTYSSYSADGSRGYETRLLTDIADQVVAVQFIALDPRALPPPPEPLPP
jgi:hypothetical protein